MSDRRAAPPAAMPDPMPATDPSRYWFPAKKHGWGWGTPNTWQGWASFGVYLLALVGGMSLIDGHARPDLMAAYLVTISAALLIVCWRKGEPPRWRWGDRRRG